MIGNLIATAVLSLTCSAIGRHRKKESWVVRRAMRQIEEQRAKELEQQQKQEK
jgi:hypothetical protein